MAEFSGFFDSHLVDGKYDRAYLAEHFAKYFASFIGNGIFGGNSNELMVLQNETANMGVRVQKGKAFINGYFYENDDELLLQLDVADGVLNRIDLIVLKFDNVERVIRLAVKKGTPSTNASAPTLQRDSDYYELALAEVYVRAGATSIIQMNITDKRLDKTVCGLVQGVVQQFDTTNFGAQIDSFIRNFETYNTTKMNEVLARLNAMADNNDLASLIIDIENLETADENIRSEAAIVNQTLGYTKKNMLPYPFTFGKTIVNNGITFTDNGDGTVTANGTATANAYCALFAGKAFALGKYLVTSGNDIQGKHFSYIRFTSRENGLEIPGTTFFSFNGDPIEITEDNAALYDLFVGLTVSKGTTVSNVVFKPMVRSAEILDDTWEPYKLSVAEMIQEDKDEKGCFYRINQITGMKEWINPPSRPGIWYPLAERWQGKPLHQLTYYVASLPVNSTMLVEMPVEWSEIVSIEAHALDADDLTYYPFPIILHSQVTPLAVISRVEGDGSLVITTNGDASRFEAYITVKYTREL